MNYVNSYSSPLGDIFLAADDEGLTELWFIGQKNRVNNLKTECKSEDLNIFNQTKHWLDIYFSGQEPDFTPPIHMIGSTFRIAVWQLLLKIPYGKTTTYGELAKSIANHRDLGKMSARAIGGAIAHNPISIIIPCHRVVGSDGSLTGYAGGIDRKLKLLNLEKVDTN